MDVTASAQLGGREIASRLLGIRSLQRARAREQRVPLLVGNRPIAHVTERGDCTDPREQRIAIAGIAETTPKAHDKRRGTTRPSRASRSAPVFELALRPQPNGARGA